MVPTVMNTCTSRQTHRQSERQSEGLLGWSLLWCRCCMMGVSSHASSRSHDSSHVIWRDTFACTCTLCLLDMQLKCPSVWEQYNLVKRLSCKSHSQCVARLTVRLTPCRLTHSDRHLTDGPGCHDWRWKPLMMILVTTRAHFQFVMS